MSVTVGRPHTSAASVFAPAQGAPRLRSVAAISPAGGTCARPSTHLSQQARLIKTAAAAPSHMADPTTADNGAGATKLALKVAVFSASDYVLDFLEKPLEVFEEAKFFEARLDKNTAKLAEGYDAVCLFVNDDCSTDAVNVLADVGVKTIAMRCAGFDRLDLATAAARGIRVVRVPAYSPRSVAEMALTMIMAAARNLRAAHQKVAVGNYTLSGLVGSEVSFKTYGIVGTGKIGLELVKLLQGFEGKVLAYDPYPCPIARGLGVEYVELEQLLRESDIVSLHTPLLPSTRHIMNRERLLMMKPDAILINVSRGGLIDSRALLEVLEEGGDHDQATGGTLAAVALDVYENEDLLFFEDWSRMSAKKRMRSWDNSFSILKSLPQVLITPHIAFLTNEALANIADTTVANLTAVATGAELVNEVKPPPA